MIPIIDLHCDLLCYLEADSKTTPYDNRARCSIPQLHAGGVKVQVCAIYTETLKGSAAKGLRQAELLASLAQKHPEDVEIVTPEWWKTFEGTKKIGLMPAFENASSFCEEDDTLDTAFKRLELVEDSCGKIAYISLTWNQENRFGGPAESRNGLKHDGKELLTFLDGRNIAVDLSHASDALAHDILTHIDLRGLDIPVIASHSNARTVENKPRNLPDELILEIIRRGGVIGLNFVRKFAGSFGKQIEHFLKLGAEKSLVLGADFFYDDGINLRRPPEGWYYPEYQDATCYQAFVQRYGINEDIAFGNARRFLMELTTEKIYE